MSTEENVKLVDRWLELYNNDVHRMIDEFYADGFAVVCPGIIEISEKAEFHEIERAVLAAAPDRKMRIVRVLAVDDHVITEAVLYGTKADGSQWESPLCEIFTFQDGLVAHEVAYIDATTWPGIEKPQ